MSYEKEEHMRAKEEEEHTEQREGGEHFVDAQHVVVDERQDEQHGEDGAREEGHVLGEDDEQRRAEAAQVLHGRLVRRVQAHVEVVLELVVVAQCEPRVVGPAARAQRTRRPLQRLRAQPKSTRVQYSTVECRVEESRVQYSRGKRSVLAGSGWHIHFTCECDEQS